MAKRERESVAKGDVSVERLPKEYNFFLPGASGENGWVVPAGTKI